MEMNRLTQTLYQNCGEQSAETDTIIDLIKGTNDLYQTLYDLSAGQIDPILSTTKDYIVLMWEVNRRRGTVMYYYTFDFDGKLTHSKLRRTSVRLNHGYNNFRYILVNGQRARTGCDRWGDVI